MDIAAEDLSRLHELYGQGLYLQAHELAARLGPMRDWSGTAARLLGGRLAMQLGGPRLGRWLHLRAWRDQPTHPEAVYFRARHVLERKGPLAAWEFMDRHGDFADAAPDVRADWYGLRAFIAGRLRDFAAADDWFARADQAAPGRTWVWVERASVMEFADRLEEGLAAARHALAERPFFRPAVQSAAHLLLRLHRDEEARALLEEAAPRLESGAVAAQLAA